MVIIPNSDFPAYVETIVLDNIPFVFGFTWNTRDESWSMSISRAGVLLLASVKIVNKNELISRYKNVQLPQGAILTIELQTVDHNPNREELGTSVKLAYVTAEEVENGTL